MSAVRFAPMPHSPDFDGIGIRADEEYAVVADTQPQFISPVQGFDISNTGLSESVESREDMHCIWFA
jgi:hypothetical protein